VWYADGPSGDGSGLHSDWERVAWCTLILGLILMAAAWWLFLRESRQYQLLGS